MKFISNERLLEQKMKWTLSQLLYYVVLPTTSAAERLFSSYLDAGCGDDS